MMTINTWDTIAARMKMKILKTGIQVAEVLKTLMTPAIAIGTRMTRYTIPSKIPKNPLHHAVQKQKKPTRKTMVKTNAALEMIPVP
jgi:hypothetical protein